MTTPTEAGSDPRRSLDNGGIYDAIRNSIIRGQYAPGERLIETRLAEEFGVSRTRIRDALARLQADHLVSPAANRGLVVRPLSLRDTEEIYALRLLLEGYAAATAATTITSRELDELAAIHERMVEAEHSNGEKNDEERLAMVLAITDINNAFHRLIQHASRNRRLEAVLRTIVSVPLVSQSFYWYSDRELTESCAEHQGILAALQAHDGPRAELLMKQHITRGLNTLRREVPRS